MCTRACRFCAVDTGNPHGWLDAEEPQQVAASVALMRLRYVVLIPVDRDDLPDGGAAHYAACIRAIRNVTADTAVEALTPDFQGVLRDVETVVDSGPQVFAQTSRRCAGYQQTLAVLAHAKRHRPGMLTHQEQSRARHRRERAADCAVHGRSALGCGRYPDAWPVPAADGEHLSVERFVTPEQFELYRAWGLARGFRECVAGPLVRSSYRAEKALAGNNVGLKAAVAPA